MFDAVSPYTHQKVVLEIDFSGCFWGYTEITIVPTSSELRTIHIHSRQCTIHKVTVAGHPADFTHHDYLANISMGNSGDSKDCHRHPELKRRIYSAMQESDEGELSISIPKEVHLRQSGHILAGMVSEAATPEPQTPGVGYTQSLPEFSPIVVQIHYSLRNPVDGFEFILPSTAYPYRVPHAYTTQSSPDSARCWVPCVDNLWERCTWDFEFVVPRYLEERTGGEDEDTSELTPTVVVCSGELVEQVSHPYNSNKTIFLFTQSFLTSVQHIAFAAGPFYVHTIAVDGSLDETAGVSQPPMLAFCLPGQESWVATSTAHMRTAMSFYCSEYGSYPFGSYKLVFVDELPTQRIDSSTMSLFSSDLLHGEDAIDQAIEARQALVNALACQWANINIQPKTWSDLWLTNGLALYITGLCMRKLFGTNDYRYKLKKDMQRVIEWDIGLMPPICQPQVLEPPDASTLPFINLKAPLVLHILDRRLTKSGTSLGLSRVLPKLFLAAISGEMQNNALSTHAFLRTCRKVSGVDPRSFSEQWIYGSGCPSFGFSASFNRKKMAVEIMMRQESPAYKVSEDNPISKTLLKPVPFFEGQMTIRIHEADGTPYEHVLDIRSAFKRYEVPFNTKYKRVRRNTKRYLARQAAAQAAAEGDTEAAEAIGMIDMGFGLEIWEKEQERENWKVADWTEEDENIMSGATYEWIRMDADFEWIAKIKFDQPDFMWVSQLQRDRDVVAQLEALYALAEKPTAIVSSTLTKTVLVSNYYYRVRCEAAMALVNCAIRQLDFLGLFHLFKLFLRYCYEPEDPNQDLFTHTYVPKPNDFTDFPEYFVRKSLINAISRIRFENGKSPAVVRQFLIDQLRYNDNTTNPYSDAFYMCTIITAAACATISTAPPERGELLPTEVRLEENPEDANLLKQVTIEVQRYRDMDRLISSYHNIVTLSTLEFHLLLTTANLIPNQIHEIFPLTREGHYEQVRIAAFDILFLSKWYTPPVMNYVLAVIANDPSRIVRRHVARNMCYSLALLVQMGEMKSNLKEMDSLLIEEDGSIPDKAREAKKSELDMMIKILRKDREVGKNEILRQYLMPIALAPNVDHEVRWCLLKLADILIRGVEETPPSVKLHIPSTPVIETAPQLPVVKVAPKPSRPIKPTAPPTRSPLSSPHPSSTPAHKVRIPVAPGPDVPTSKVPHTSAGISKRPAVSSFNVSTPANKLKGRSLKNAEKPEKADKQVNVPKAQTAGMSLNDLRACRNALKKLRANKHALIFNQPVDPVRDNAPRYFEIVKKPMDLSTMSAKVEAGMYKDRFAFQADFKLMTENAKHYNTPGSFAHNEALSLEFFFEKQWTIINKTLEAADKAQASMPPPPIPSSIAIQTPRKLAPPRPSTPVLSTRPSLQLTTSATASVHPRTSASSSTPATSKSLIPASTPASRPTIKLKMGTPSASGRISEEASTPTPKPRGGIAQRKPKQPSVEESTFEPPPPPYIDDGSHDILQEVLAIEREKEDEKRHRNSSERIGPNASNKRKKADDSIDEDDILALATPSKKEKPSPPGSSSIPPSKAKLVVPPAARPISSMPKFKKDRPADRQDKEQSKEKEKEEKAQGGEKATIEKEKKEEKEKAKVKGKEREIPQARTHPRPSAKGKEKEIAPRPIAKASTPTPLNPPQPKSHIKARVGANPSTSPIAPALPTTTPINEKRCRDILKMLIKIPESLIFIRPVDPIADGCPTYLDEITHPMDLGTASNKLTQGDYETMEAFAKDMDLIWKNCRQFNPGGTYPIMCTEIMERAWKKEWAKAMEKKLSWLEKRGLQGIMNTLAKEELVSWVFRDPVDPVKLGIPTYFDVIPRRDARDLRTIRNKLDTDRYDTVEAFEFDMELMISNAIKFNTLESEVGQMAISMRDRVQELMVAWKSSAAKKRKEGDRSTPQPTKKVKLG